MDTMFTWSGKEYNSQDMVFFIGGYDAEMKTIVDLLQENNLLFYDHKLSWGAAISSYQKEISSLTEDQTAVIIELKEDSPFPPNSIVIDHHNKRHKEKSSLEQIADLTGIKLNRKQLLIAANDSGHIKGMRSAGATETEINEIRKFDRECQGVTKADEEMAKDSIENRLSFLNNDIVFIESTTNFTSPVIDLLYDKYDNILIKTPDHGMTFSGKRKFINKLISHYTELKNNNVKIEFWSGGVSDDEGFFGSNFFSKEIF